MNPIAAFVKVIRRGPSIPAPFRTAWRHKPTFFGKLAMERWVGMSASVPAELKSLASMRAGAMVGCLW